MRVVFPLLRPITGTVAILTGVIIWNEFFISLIFLSGSDAETLPVAVYLVRRRVPDASGTSSSPASRSSPAPILVFFLFAQR